MTTLELQYVSQKLQDAKDLQLAVPGCFIYVFVLIHAGTYKAGEQIVFIKQIAPILTVISSKQRPRKLTIIGSNNVEYKFLLKG